MRRELYAWLPTLIITMTVAALVFGLRAFQAVETRQLALAGNSLAVTASEIAGNLDRYLDQTLSYISVAANSSVFRDRDPVAMNEYLEVVQADREQGFLWLGATDAAGRIIASTDPSTLGQDRSNSTWFQAVRDTGAASVGDVEMFLEAGGVEAVPLTVPILDLQGTFQGTITARVSIPALEEVVTSTIHSVQEHLHLPGNYEYQFLLRDGSAFVDSDLEHKGNVNLKHLGLRSAILTETGKPGYVEEEHLRRHIRVVTGYAKTRNREGPTGPQWDILLRMDRSEILAPIWEDLRNLTIAGAVIWTPMFALLLWSTRRLRTEWRQAQDEAERARAAEASLRQSEGRFRELIELSQDAICLLNEKGEFIATNPAGCRLFGYTEQELKGMSVLNTYAPEERLAAVRQLQQISRGGPLRFERLAVRKDGTTVPIDVSLSPMNGGRYQAIVRDITERKRTEEALRMQARVLESMLEGVSLSNENGVILYTNPAEDAMFGHEPGELIGKHVTTLNSYPPDGNARIVEGIIEQLKVKGSWEGTFNNRRKDGVPFTTFARITSLELHGKKHWVCVQEDVTERKRSEEYTERLSRVLEDSLNEIYLFDAESLKFLVVNRGARENLGYTMEELRVLTPLDLKPEYLTESFTALIEPLRSGAQNLLTFITVHRRKDGSHYPVEVHLQLQSVGASSWFVAIILDITERRRAEEALLTSEKLFRTAFEETAVGMALLRPNGQYLHANDVLCELLGYTQAELRSKTFHEVTHPDDLAGNLQSVEQLLRGNKDSLHIEKRYIHKLGQPVWTFVSVSVVRDSTGRPVSLISQVQDISERKRAEEALRSSEWALRTALEDREHLMQNLHDGIIQSLYAIGMSADECRRLTDEDPHKAGIKLGQTVDDINRVIREVRHHLVQGVDDMPFSASRFKAELTRVAGTMERANALHFRLKVDQRAAECLTTEERKEILYVAQETMSNCLRHSGASVANVSLRLGRDRVVLEVEDDGRGFDTTTLIGTSGGLYNIERRAQKVGARVEIVSHREHGTRIRVLVPMRT